jgi:rubrerythrin
VGGRSRVAAQMLAGKGFAHIYNLSGGIKAWNGEVAYGAEDLGLALFSGREAPETILTVAYSLEQGLQDFYLSMKTKVSNEEVGTLFGRLADIEEKHKDRIFGFYCELVGTVSRDEFDHALVVQAVEGGLTTEEYLDRFHVDWESSINVIAAAMSIEAQALDLYQRAARKRELATGRGFLEQIASEEKMHLKKLGELIDTM